MIQICHICPDATICNGPHTPVCRADRLHHRSQGERDTVFESVYEHLCER